MRRLLIWSSAEQYLRQAIELVSILVLSRLLFPTEFGMFALTSFVISVSNTLTEGGFRNVIIKKELNQEQLSGIFWYNLGVSAIIFVFICFAARFLEKFYEMEGFALVLIVLSSNILLNSYGLVPATNLLKQGKFKDLLMASLPATILSCLLGVAFAYFQFGIWSLVAKTLSLTILQMCAFYSITKWTPALKVNILSIRENFKEGSNFMFANIVNTVYNESVNNIIGKVYSVSTLGYFGQGKKLSDYISQNVTSLIGRVSLPLMVNRENIYENYLKLMRLVLLVTFPIVFFVYLNADPIVDLLLGKRWAFSGTILKILVFQGVFYPVSKITSNLLIFKISSRNVLLLELAKKSVYMLIILFVIAQKCEIETFVLIFVGISAIDALVNLGPIIGDFRIFGGQLLKIIFTSVILISLNVLFIKAIISYFNIPLLLNAFIYFGGYLILIYTFYYKQINLRLTK